MIPIIKKEFRTYFTSMTGYIFIGFLILITGIYFSLVNVMNLDPDYSYVLSGTSIVFLILIPTLTMRLFAEEIRQKTDQLLFTSPVSVLQIVLAKYFAAVLLFALTMVITMIYPIVLSQFGEIPIAKIAGAYIGYILLGACFIGVGMFISVLTDNQIVAAVATFAALFLFYIMNSLASGMPADRISSFVFIGFVVISFALLIYDSTKNIFASAIVCVISIICCVAAFFLNNVVYDGIMVKVLTWFSVLARFENFNKGVLNVADIVYYVTFAIAFVYLTVNVIEKRRWR